MNISYQWLRQYLPLEESAETLSHLLTMAGLEVEGIELFEQVKGSLRGVVVGEVLTCEKHPNADRLKVTTVRLATGADPVQIVCGAPNVAVGQKVLVATVGTTLYPVGAEKPLVLQDSKIRGEVSKGMICAEDELGLGTSHDGIMVLPADAPIGMPAAEYLKLYNDQVFSIGLTPNRTDAISHYGVARDLAAVLNKKAQLPVIPSFALSGPCSVEVSVTHPAGAPRYTGRVITGLTVTESPAWLKQRLEAIGQRSINNVVDITNYVLHELGHPLHAFDMAHITGNQIVVGPVAEGTPFTTLDGIERKLAASDLMISNAQVPMCLAGTMGGQQSGVTENTTGIFLEAAYFDAATVRTQARRHGIHSDSSYRFERGVDPNTVLLALDRATALILEVAGGAASAHIDTHPQPFPQAEVVLSFDHVRTLIGKPLTDAEISDLLNRLEMAHTPTGDGNMRVLIPTYRVDVTRPQDVVEDVLRIYGQNNVAPAARINASLPAQAAYNAAAFRERVANLLAGAGWLEALNNSLIPLSWGEEATAVRLLNPLSEELSAMRQNLMMGLLESVSYNLARKSQQLALFETGKIYFQSNGKCFEQWRLALALTGPVHEEHWRNKPHTADYFTLKGNLHRLLSRLGLSAEEAVLADDANYAYGATLKVGKQVVGKYGAVNGQLLQQFDIRQTVYFAELDIEKLESLCSNLKVEYTELPKLLPVRRDLSLVVPRAVTFAAIRTAIAQANTALVQSVDLFDVYDKLGPDQVSYAVSVTVLDRNKTLTDEAVDKLMQRVMQKLNELGVTLRS